MIDPTRARRLVLPLDRREAREMRERKDATRAPYLGFRPSGFGNTRRCPGCGDSWSHHHVGNPDRATTRPCGYAGLAPRWSNGRRRRK